LAIAKLHAKIGAESVHVRRLVIERKDHDPDDIDDGNRRHGRPAPSLYFLYNKASPPDMQTAAPAG